MAYLTKTNKKTLTDKPIALFSMATWTGPDHNRKFTLMFYDQSERRSYLVDFGKSEMDYIIKKYRENK